MVAVVDAALDQHDVATTTTTITSTSDDSKVEQNNNNKMINHTRELKEEEKSEAKAIEKEKEKEKVPIEFCTFGMFILDEIHYPPPKPSVYNVIGGGGTFAALGARLFSPAPTLSRSVGWVVHAGSDFPDEVRSTIAAWQTGCVLCETKHRLTTRGWNEFNENEERAFRYATPKEQLTAETLTPELLRSKAFHLICSSKRCIDIVTKVKQARKALGDTPEPVFIWEPIPYVATPDELAICQEAVQLVDVVSPNHIELCQFFGREKDAYDAVGDARIDVIRECVKDWLDLGIGSNGKGAAVIRMGKDGCYIFTREAASAMPAYYEAAGSAHRKVLDPTGGGNAFLGGFTIAMARLGSKNDFATLQEAAVWGSVAASFVIEQVGIPHLSYSNKEGLETWNGDVVEHRVAQFKDRLKTYIQPPQ